MLVLAPPGKRLRFEGSLLLAVLRGHIPLLYHMSSHCLRLDLFARSFAGGYTGDFLSGTVRAGLLGLALSSAHS